MKLISMTEKVLSVYKERMNTPYNDGVLTAMDAERFVNYANFLSQPLTLGMFVPCVDNVPLEEPIKYKNWNDYNYSGTDIGFKDEAECRAYDKAKDNVLFEGFEVDMRGDGFNDVLILDKEFFKDHKTIEDLTKYNLTLTEQAKQQLKQ